MDGGGEAERAAALLDQAIGRIGLERFGDPARGPALIADLVGGADVRLTTRSRALEAVCAAWATHQLTDPTRLGDLATSGSLERPLVEWAASVWLRAVAQHAAADPAGASGGGAGATTPGVAPPEPLDRFRPIPVVVVAGLILAVVVLLLL